MKEDYVSQETARLALSKGAPIKHTYKYSHESKLIDENYIAEKITASSLAKWLREEKDIIVESLYEGMDGFYYKIYSTEKYDASGKNFKSYLEALEQGIIKALNLLPNVRN